jgi:hypothetical protein
MVLAEAHGRSEFRVLTLFEVPSVELFEADFPLRFPHAVERTGSGSGNGARSSQDGVPWVRRWLADSPPRYARGGQRRSGQRGASQGHRAHAAQSARLAQVNAVVMRSSTELGGGARTAGTHRRIQCRHRHGPRRQAARRPTSDVDGTELKVSRRSFVTRDMMESRDGEQLLSF